MHIQYIQSCLQKWFSFPENKLFCQVSTVAKNNPHIRTMDLYDITEDGRLIFLTDTSTQKWKDLQQCQNIAVCMLHLEYGQIIVEGIAALKTSVNDSYSVSLYWHNFLDQYWRDFYVSRTVKTSNNIPESFGLIEITPSIWEILEINPYDFLKSSRKQFKLMNGKWSTHDLLPV